MGSFLHSESEERVSNQFFENKFLRIWTNFFSNIGMIDTHLAIIKEIEIEFLESNRDSFEILFKISPNF